MGGEQVAESNGNNIIQSVTSAGSSWIICRSKSHSGRIYYFNTLTGEAAWNLSEPEIEKAKNSTKKFLCQGVGEFEGCPEPKEPPLDISPTNNEESHKKPQMLYPPRVYNKQIINNQFSKQTFAPFGGHCTNCNTHVIQSSIDPFGLNDPIPHNCSPNVWAIPPNHQIGIAPSTSPVTNSPQTCINVGYDNNNKNVHVQNTSLSLSSRFNLIQNSIASRNIQRRGPYFKKFNNSSAPDLRQKLSARRLLSNWNKPTEDNEQDSGDKTTAFRNDTQKIQIIKPVLDTTILSDADDKWLKKNTTFQGTQLILNVSPLKILVSSAENCMSWYVVADTNVLLNNINLINVIVNSDETCQLMVPDYIMAELQNTSRQYNNRLMSRSNYVLQILSQQFAAGYAVMGKDPSTDLNKNHIYDFCFQLSKQGYDVVLVSNNIQMEKYRSFNVLPILTVSELKDLLLADKSATVGKQSLCPLSQIKITIPNIIDINTDNTIPDLVSSSKETQNVHYKPQMNNIEKQCQDVGVQTDIELCLPPNKTTSTESTQTDFPDSAESETKRRGIQLKRKLSYQQTTDNVEKKQFKWRRRKLLESAPKTTLAEKPEINCTRSWETKMGTSETSNNCSETTGNTDKEVPINDGGSACYDHIDSSKTRSSCFVQKNIPEEIVIIGETSSSDIVSNSCSNNDSDNMVHAKPNEQMYIQNVNEDKDKNKCAMFEVESPAMEEYLKMRCDEWISRFVQIMEEVLTQILQQKPAFLNRALPPPWTIHEATECIKKKFCHDSDVIDAANKLTFVLFKISDGRGKIKTELKPPEFMEMYSYGVYLIDSLQMALPNCEDLRTAADSLAKLLNDIVDPGQGHAEGFIDISHISDANVTQIRKVSDNIVNYNASDIVKTPEKLLPNVKSPSGATCNQKKYNLRSTQKKQAVNQEEKDMPVKFIRNIDIESTFFSCLHLKKKDDGMRKNFDEMKKSDEVQNNESINEPKIIRNFSKCLAYEEKLKRKQQNTSKYSEELEEGEIAEYNCYIEEYNSDYEYEEYDDDGEIAQEGKEINKSKLSDHVIGKIFNEIQEAFLKVHSFCIKTKDELNDVSKISAPKKLNILEKAEKANSSMDILCKSLNSIIHREKTKCENNLQAVLKDAGIYLNTVKSKEYRNMISKYSSQANILLDAVKVIIGAVNELV